MEQLTRLTNSEDFIENWSLYCVGTKLLARTDIMVLTLEAYYVGFEESRSEEKQIWEIRCDGFFNQKVEMGYLRPFCQIKILKDHPVLWNYGAESYFSITGTADRVSELMGDLIIVHTERCGNWVDFHQLFGSLPDILKSRSDNQLAVPQPLLSHYLTILEKYGVTYTLNSDQENRVGLSVLMFTSNDYSDNYSYGQPYIVAENFEEFRCA